MRMPVQLKYVVATNDKSSDAQKTNFNLMGNPDSGDCTLTITDARREDEGVYYFRFQESKDSAVKYNYYKVTTAIKVTDLTEEPVISDVGSLIAGVNKTVTCAPLRNCPGNSLAFQWKKSNVAGIWKNSSTITFTPSIEDDQETITCEMTSSSGKTTQKHIYLNFDCLTEEPVISDFGTLIVGVNKTLTCAPPGNCPVKSLAFLWKKSNVAGIWTNLSTITFTPSIEDDQETITCEITNSRGNTTQKLIHLNVDLPLLKDPKVIAGLITGIIIVVSAILLGIVFLVRRKKKAEPSSLNNHPSNSKTASEEIYANIPRTRNSNRTCVAMEDVHRSDNIYMNIEN
ncbi:sialic acid-binding Ig-like lectin 7 [Bufo gargarizans]|uniref:sialic acid-binding Ig-like lectin 7 n=1 Tax=Bufo gargarizans TaxID=30331 RepID=UPI001CF51EDC|nr:sialic acid-binding Ig-like lectin 7 [Bufo gargarizans]